MSCLDITDPRLGVTEAAAMLHARWGQVPDLTVIAGSGLSVLRQLGTVIDTIAYHDLPGMQSSTVSGHGSDLCLLQCGTARVALFTGRLHLYEGYQPHTIAQQLALMSSLGVRSALLTNASGGLHPLRSVGDVVVVSDIINWTFRRIASTISVAHESPSSVVSHSWRDALLRSATQAGLPLHQGVFAQMLGPSYETRAEIRMLRRLGADLVGMSSGVEARWAASMGMHVAIVSLVTNTLTDSSVRCVSHDEVLEAGVQAQNRMCEAVRHAIAARPLTD